MCIITKDIIWRFILFLSGISLIIIDILFGLWQKDYLSITFWGILIGTIFLLSSLFLRVSDFILTWLIGDITKLNCETLRAYHLKFFDILGIIFTTFGLVLAILWGLSAVGPEGRTISFNELHLQTIVLVLFLFYTSLVLITTLGKSLKNQIQKVCNI